jgi:hypothetical protein
MLRVLVVLLSLSTAAMGVTVPGTWTPWRVTSYGMKFVGSRSTTTVQVGTYYSPTFTAASNGIDGLRLEPHVGGATPYFTTLSLYPPIVDSGGSVGHMTLLDLMDCIDGDSSCYAIRTRKGHVLIGDTLSAARLLQQGGGEQLHGSLLQKSRQISADTDHILIFYPDSGHTIHDTLALLSQCLGCDYWFIQYQISIDSPIVIVPHVGEKIEGFDSVSMRSNLGISILHLYGQGDRWRVLYHHEKGAWLAYMNTISDVAQDTAWYTIDNLTSVHAWTKPLSGTSSPSIGKAFGILGANANFTDASLDTTYTSVAAMDVQDSGIAVPGICTFYWNGAGTRCTKNDTTSFKGHGPKGPLRMLDFFRDLPRPPVHR